jgi:hypothetical protein
MTALSNARFALAFSQSKIGELSARYHNYDEEVVFAAGQRIAAGNLSIAVRVEDEGARPIAVGSRTLPSMSRTRCGWRLLLGPSGVPFPF